MIWIWYSKGSLVTLNYTDMQLAWCKKQITNKEDFKNVIFTDECTVQLEYHNKICKKQPRLLKQKPKHPAKVHIWEESQLKVQPRLSDIMNAIRYGQILAASLIPFIQDHYLRGHHLNQDNDPKHTSRYIQQFFADNSNNPSRIP